MNSQEICPKCGGAKSYFYDENHAKPCELCCPHDCGWYQLSEHQGGYLEGGNNNCCLRGCGQLQRKLKMAEITIDDLFRGAEPQLMELASALIAGTPASLAGETILEPVRQILEANAKTQLNLAYVAYGVLSGISQTKSQ